MSDLSRRPFAMPLGPLANGGDSLQDSFSRPAKSSAKP
jgi:hypothetical protein